MAASRPQWRTMVVILLVMKSIRYVPEWTVLCWGKRIKIHCAVQTTVITKATTVHKYPGRNRLSSLMVNKRENLVRLEE